MMECQLENINLYYEVCGTGRPLIAIHGFTPDHHLMTGCMEPVFAQRNGWRRFYPDLPGMGKTPGPKWPANSDRMLDVLLDFIDAVVPGQNFVLAGESYGGYLARGIVHRWPERVIETPWGKQLSLRWIVWHVFDHKLHHRGEIFLMLGLQGIQGPDI